MKRTPEEENFRRNIFLWRNYRGMTQLQVAMKAGIQQTSISHYERGAAIPLPETAQWVADALGVDLEVLQQNGFDSSSPTTLQSSPF